MRERRSTKRPEYIPGAPLYARSRMQFSGVVVERDEQIPDRPERKRRKLWEARKVTHLRRVAKPLALDPVPSKRRQRRPPNAE